ncbi:hypothetical protein JW933_09380 [candidate division FCPU426 bacterium]|nr:hypothetical protein [candidate division FCPU426 bacterium]
MSIRFGRSLLIMTLALTVGAATLASAQDEEKDELAGPPEKKEESKADSQEVVIRGVQRLKVKVEKPEPDVTFDVDEIAVPYVVTEDSVMDVSPTSMAYPAVSVPVELNSTQSAAPYIQLFKQPPVLTLNPRYKGNVNIAKWRLRITDGFGNVFKDYSGESNLPKQLIWDGRGKDNKEMMDVGTSYSYIFSIVDVASNPTSQMGKPIVLESLLYEENGEIIARLVAEAIFEKKGVKTEISQKGKLYLKEVADLLMYRQRFPLLIESYFGDVDEASYQGERIQKYLEELMILPEKKIKVVARKSRLKKVVFIIK